MAIRAPRVAVEKLRDVLRRPSASRECTLQFRTCAGSCLS